MPGTNVKIHISRTRHLFLQELYFGFQFYRFFQSLWRFGRNQNILFLDIFSFFIYICIYKEIEILEVFKNNQGSWKASQVVCIWLVRICLGCSASCFIHGNISALSNWSKSTVQHICYLTDIFIWRWIGL